MITPFQATFQSYGYHPLNGTLFCGIVDVLRRWLCCSYAATLHRMSSYPYRQIPSETGVTSDQGAPQTGSKITSSVVFMFVMKLPDSVVHMGADCFQRIPLQIQISELESSAPNQGPFQRFADTAWSRPFPGPSVQMSFETLVLTVAFKNSMKHIS